MEPDPYGRFLRAARWAEVNARNTFDALVYRRAAVILYRIAAVAAVIRESVSVCVEIGRWVVAWTYGPHDSPHGAGVAVDDQACAVDRVQGFDCDLISEAADGLVR